jgi:hypothetical protein
MPRLPFRGARERHSTSPRQRPRAPKKVLSPTNAVRVAARRGDMSREQAKRGTTQRVATPRNIFFIFPAARSFLSLPQRVNGATAQWRRTSVAWSQRPGSRGPVRCRPHHRLPLGNVAFQRELDRQRRARWEQAAGEIGSMVKPALSILRSQLTGDDPKLAMRAASVLLRFATPAASRPAPVPPAFPHRSTPISNSRTT